MRLFETFRLEIAESSIFSCSLSIFLLFLIVLRVALWRIKCFKFFELLIFKSFFSLLYWYTCIFGEILPEVEVNLFFGFFLSWEKSNFQLFWAIFSIWLWLKKLTSSFLLEVEVKGLTRIGLCVLSFLHKFNKCSYFLKFVWTLHFANYLILP